MPDDADCVQRACAGDGDAYAELFRRHAPRVGAVCAARLGWRGPLEDMVQETFTRAWRELATLDRAERFPAWLRGIALRVCTDWLRRRGREEHALVPLAEEAHSAAGDEASLPGERDESTRALLEAVDALPEIYRETLLLYYFGQRSHAEIAATLGIGTAAVNARLGKARALLRGSLAREA